MANIFGSILGGPTPGTDSAASAEAQRRITTGVVQTPYYPNMGSTTTVDIHNEQSRMSMLEMRLRVRQGDLKASLHGLGTTFEGGEKVFVHFARNDELVVFEDSAGLFPSDALITKLRLCI